MAETEKVQIETIPSEPVEEDVIEEVVEEKVLEPATTTEKLSKKEQRLKAIENFKNGVDDPSFKVQKLKNGQFRVSKRRNESITPESVEERVMTKFDNKQLSTEQLLLEHMFELERKCEALRLKHKKLKKRYNKLEDDIFEDDDYEHRIDVNTISQEVVPEKPQTVQETPTIEPQIRYNKQKKPTWRSMVKYM